ncbi:MAG: transposase [Ktedonobacteraceae bacterium]|nr:transposase [Ktedonobacteraceae bacterium]
MKPRIERYSSQTCPVCGERSKHRRIDCCPHCRATGPRDAVGATPYPLVSVTLPGRCLPLAQEFGRTPRT